MKDLTLQEMMILVEQDRRTLNAGTEDYNQFLEKLIVDIQDVKKSLKSGKDRHKHRKEVARLQGAIEALKYLEKKSTKKMLLNQNSINENESFDNFNVRRFLRGISDES